MLPWFYLRIESATRLPSLSQWSTSKICAPTVLWSIENIERLLLIGDRPFSQKVETFRQCQIFLFGLIPAMKPITNHSFVPFMITQSALMPSWALLLLPPSVLLLLPPPTLLLLRSEQGLHSELPGLPFFLQS